MFTFAYPTACGDCPYNFKKTLLSCSSTLLVLLDIMCSLSITRVRIKRNWIFLTSSSSCSLSKTWLLNSPSLREIPNSRTNCLIFIFLTEVHNGSLRLSVRNAAKRQLCSVMEISTNVLIATLSRIALKIWEMMQKAIAAIHVGAIR